MKFRNRICGGFDTNFNFNLQTESKQTRILKNRIGKKEKKEKQKYKENLRINKNLILIYIFL